MSPYEVVNLIQAINRHDPDWLPLAVDHRGISYSLECVRMRDQKRVKFETCREWFEDITDRGIEIPYVAFRLFSGVNDVKERQKALRS